MFDEGQVETNRQGARDIDPGRLYHCGGWDEAANSIRVSFFSGGVHCRHLRYANVLAAQIFQKSCSLC